MTKTNEDTDRLIMAVEYAGYGWRVLPIRPASKLPIVKAWQRAATAEKTAIIAWWKKWPTANVGICLGEGSNLIDIECDSEQAEKDYLSLFDGDLPVTATYQGARGKHRLFRWHKELPGGAVIHLGKIEVRTGNVGKGAQSVFPPSIHPSGIAYQWLVPPSECPPVAIPDAILARLWNLAGDDLAPPPGDDVGEHTATERATLYVETIEGSTEGGRNKQGYRVACVLLRDFALPQADAWPILEAWNQRNQPPLEEKELRQCATSAEKYGLGVVGSKLDGTAPTKPRRPKKWEPKQASESLDLDADTAVDMASYSQMIVNQGRELVKQQHVKLLFQAVRAVNLHLEHPLDENELKAVFTLALKTERSKRMAQQAEEVLNPSPENAIDRAAQQGTRPVWKMTIVHSDPPRYELHSPLFRKVPFIVLDSKQMNSPGAIRVAALDQAECALPKAFDKLWGSPGGLYETVIHTADHRAAPLEDQRHLVVANCLRGKLAKARIIEEGKEPDSRGRPCLMPDGSIVFIFDSVWEELWQGPHRIEKGELSKLLQTLGVKWRKFGPRGKQSPRFKCLPRSAIEDMEKMLEEASRSTPWGTDENDGGVLPDGNGGKAEPYSKNDQQNNP